MAPSGILPRTGFSAIVQVPVMHPTHNFLKCDCALDCEEHCCGSETESL